MNKIIVLDFGGQYSQLIARRIRELGTLSELVPYSVSATNLKSLDPTGIVLSGGPASIYEEDAPRCDPFIFGLDIPTLGICYGMQLLADHFGGLVVQSDKPEYGRIELEVTSGGLFQGLGSREWVWMSHGDSVKELPAEFNIDARSLGCPIAAFSNQGCRIYGVQFHPEVQHTDNGMEILRNFTSNICGCSGAWSMQNFVEESTTQIRAKVGADKVLCALSGGVDSAVAATLIHRAVGDQLTCFFVDHGLLRHNEAENVEAFFKEHMQMQLYKIDARKAFLEALSGVTDPEKKRKIIGAEFIKAFEKAALKYGDHKFLAQGTLYTDIIESGTQTAHTIKSHHNVGGLPENLNFELLEPLDKLFKDEVRKLGEELSLPKEIIWRQPFPGPGLAIRVIGDITKEKLDIVRQADFILHEEIEQAWLRDQVWQYFVVLTDSRSVGVMGDARTYSYVLAIRAVTSVDGMTADWARLPYEVLEKVSNRIVNEVAGVNRVVYDITSKPPATIEWE